MWQPSHALSAAIPPAIEQMLEKLRRSARCILLIRAVSRRSVPAAIPFVPLSPFLRGDGNGFQPRVWAYLADGLGLLLAASRHHLTPVSLPVALLVLSKPHPTDGSYTRPTKVPNGLSRSAGSEPLRGFVSRGHTFPAARLWAAQPNPGRPTPRGTKGTPCSGRLPGWAIPLFASRWPG